MMAERALQTVPVPGKPLSREDGLLQAQQVCQELLDIVAGICQAHNLRYWLDGGTLLGAVRHGGFIPWDDDVDICFPLSDYRRILELLREYCAQYPEYVLFFSDANFPYWCDSFGKTTWLIDGVLPVRIDLIPVKVVPNTPEALAADRSLTDVATHWTLGFLKEPDRVLSEHRGWLPATWIKRNRARHPENKNPQHTSVAINTHGANYSANFARSKTNRNLTEQGKTAFYTWFWTQFGPDPAEVALPGQPTENWCIGYSFNDALVQKIRPLYTLSDIFPLKPVTFSGKTYVAPANPNAYLRILYGDRYMEIPPESKRKTHFSQLYAAQQQPERIKELLDLLHHAGFHNLALELSDSPGWQRTRRMRRIVSFLRLITTLLVRRRFRSARNLVRYSRLHLTRL